MPAFWNALLQQRLNELPTPLALVLPSGKQLGSAQATVRLVLRNGAAMKDLLRGEVGAIAQGIVEGRIRCEGPMREVMRVAHALLRNDPRASGPKALPGLLQRWRSAHAHSRLRDAAQVQQHYDVSDAFYQLWLDEKRVYSCAYYRRTNMDLAQAQEAKLDHICCKLMLSPCERFLDIGAGWGGLLFWAAEHYGVDATGITLSRNQHAYLLQQIERRGLSGRVRAHLLDYRELQDAAGFDKIASVGMFEHVGQAHMPAYFAQIMSLLKPGACCSTTALPQAG